ncbi:hypothetical protein [Marinobacter sp. M-5]|uniref:hypothetical protein n=1 Tax=Marinobacter sp. M-5 TaxID=3081089 RepID=UPI00293D141F|nr:hypothetical protein [Marinobacter sp. M-5]MDV3504175.1 hypothetical protein [Marinobacter sp. M-5]
MKHGDQKPAIRTVLAATVATALLTMAEPGMAHSPPGAEGAPEGITRATILNEGDIGGLNVMVLDAPQPALMVRYDGAQVLTVFDNENEPFLRFTDSSVEANVRSVDWPNLPQSQGYRVDEGTHWVEVSGSGTFGWVDARLSTPEGEQPDETARWQIPVQQGDQEVSAIIGRLTWRPIVAQSTNDGH